MQNIHKHFLKRNSHILLATPKMDPHRQQKEIMLINLKLSFRVFYYKYCKMDIDCQMFSKCLGAHLCGALAGH